MNFKQSCLKITLPLIIGFSAISCASTRLETTAQSKKQGTVEVLLSSADKTHLLSKEPELEFQSKIRATNSKTDFIIQVDEKIKYQQILGFGAALLDGTATLVNNSLQPQAIDDLWVKLFDPKKGIGLSFLRLGIGASDLSPDLYSYEDQPGHFTVEHDQAVFQLVKKALALNSNLKVMGSPWSPPGWMKTNGTMIKGSLAPEHQKDFAEYLIKTIQAWKKVGLPVDAITLQNEPKNDNNFTTSLFNLHPGDKVPPLAPVDQQTFITKFLGPAVQNAGLKTKLLIWDHNYEQSGTNMIDQVLISLQDKEMRQYSGGAAFHCYSKGNVRSLAAIPQTYPGQDIYMTECSSGDWTNWKDQFNYDAASWIIDPLRAGAKVVLKWGLILDENHKPYLTAYNGSCTGCIGSIVIRNKPDGSYTGQWAYERDYYILGQISKFVQPGAYRIESNEPPGGVLKNVAFINTDNSKVLYVFNSSGEAKNFEVQASSGSFQYNLPPQSVVTFRWN